MTKFVLKFNDGRYVGIDYVSGGYPYPTNDIFQAKIWDSEIDAKQYPNSLDDIDRTVYRVNITVS